MKLIEGQEEIKQRQQRLEEILERHEKSIQELKGWQLEHKVFINICSYLGSYITIKGELFEELDEYVEKGIISQEEENDVYVTIEISYKIIGKKISKKLKFKVF